MLERLAASHHQRGHPDPGCPACCARRWQRGRGEPTGKGAPGGAAIPVTIDIPWLVELTLNLAFGLEDAGRDADAQKKADEAGQLLDEMMKEPQDPAMAERNTRLRQLVWNARAYFNRKAPGVLGGG